MKQSMLKPARRIGTRGRAWSAALLVAAVLLTGGCPPPPEVPPPPPISLREAIRRHNANVAAMPAFRAGIRDWQIRISDPASGDVHQHRDLGGAVYFRPAGPGQARPFFYLRANTGLGGDALVIGANQEAFWTYSRVANRGWWGYYDDVAQANPDELLPGPELLLQMVGLAALPTATDESPYPVFRVTDEHNVIQLIIPTADGLALRREFIFDRRTDLPVRINDYGRGGLVARSAELGDYASIGEARLPREIIIRSPGDDSFLRLQLGAPRRDDTDRGRLFARPEAPVADYQRLTPTVHHE